MRQRQQGVALILAVMIVALIAVVSVGIAERQQLDIRLTGNIIEAESAYQYALGAEAWGKGQIVRDQAGQIDHTDEDWALPLAATEFENGVIEAQIEDLQGRFNLNNLLDDQGQPVAEEVNRLRRLLTLLQLDPTLTEAVLDWLDEDTDARFPAGAEDDHYMSLDPPRSAANGPMVSTSELALIKGFDHEAYIALAPYVTALPERTAVNLNTAPAQVLALVADGLTVSEGEDLVTQREGSWYNTVADFSGNSLFDGRPVVADGLDVKSNYFLVRADAYLGRVRVKLYSVLKRNEQGEVTVVMRGQGVY